MAAPLAARKVLLPIYAFNLEVARAPWVTHEPAIAEIRLQWWRDALDEIAAGGEVRRHEVASPLAGVLDAEAARVLDGLVAARRQDCYAEPFADAAEFRSYLDDTAGGLMWVAARALGADDPAPVRAAGRAAGLAAFLLALPELATRGRQPLARLSPQAVNEVVREGLDDLAEARRGKARIAPAARPALFAGWRAPALLAQAHAAPERIGRGALAESGLRNRSALLLASLRGMI
ncbi:MAG: squalene/phytoene synthase family protein [Rhodobacteraceae bacterium]|nr:squalene/phytoene synthase family protein [Paracoccaceae bacterium]